MPPVTKKQKVKTVTPVELKYPDFMVETRLVEDGKGLTADDAKELLGWEEESDGNKFDDPFLTLPSGVKVRLTNNTKNRPWSESWSRTLAQDILRKRWRRNGETFIIGQTGQILSSQHRLIGLVFAEMERVNPKRSEYWKDFWEGPVTIDAVIVYGVEEDAATLRTLDNVKPRSLSDVLFTDPSLFKGLNSGQRKQACNMLDFAVRILWQRTGMGEDAFCFRRTHSEALEFIDRHPRVKKCVAHVAKEVFDKDSVLEKYITPGYAAGLMYLMACSESDGDNYHDARRNGKVSEGKLDWSMWDKASEFWSIVAQGQAGSVREAVAALTNTEDSDGVATRDERMSILIKAWAVFKTGEKIKDGDLKLKYVEDEDGFKQLVDYPGVEGIDLGHPKDRPDEGEEVTEEEADDEDEPTPEEVGDIEARKEEMRKKRVEEIAAKLKERKAQPKPDAAPPASPASKPPKETVSGTDHDFTKEQNPKTLTNKDGLVLNINDVVRVPGVEGVKWTLVGFFPSVDANRVKTVTARLSKVGDTKVSSNVAIDGLLPGDKPKGEMVRTKKPK